MCRYQQDCLETPSAACHCWFGAFHQGCSEAGCILPIVPLLLLLLSPPSSCHSHPPWKSMWSGRSNSSTRFDPFTALLSTPGRAGGNEAAHLCLFFIFSSHAHASCSLGSYRPTSLHHPTRHMVKGLFWSRKESKLSLEILLSWSLMFWLPVAQSYGCLMLGLLQVSWSEGLFLQLFPDLPLPGSNSPLISWPPFIWDLSLLWYLLKSTLYTYTHSVRLIGAARHTAFNDRVTYLRA